MPGPAVKVVTTISSKDSAKASSPPATSAERTSGKVMSTKVRKVWAPRSMAASSYEPGIRRSRAIDVVEDDHDAEGGVADDDGEHAEADAERFEDRTEGGVERDAGDDAGQRDRQDDHEGDGLAAEETGSAGRRRR